jgi:ParB family chromosome partitioning protein
MTKKFSMNDLLNGQSRTSDQKKGSFVIVDVSIDKLVPSSANLYGIREIEELAANIESVGLLHNLVVRHKDGNYEIISGERRYRACKLLFDGGNTAFASLPCKVETEESDTMAELKLIFANATARELTDYEKTEQARRMKELFRKLREEGYKLEGRLRDIVADMLDVSPSQVSKMESVAERLIPELTEEFKQGAIGITDAYAASTLPPEQQRGVLEDYKRDGAEAIKKAKKPTPLKTPPRESKKRTNADWIRCMTLGELAHFLSDWKPWKNDLTIMEWLNQEANIRDE